MSKLVGDYTNAILVRVINMQQDPAERTAFARIAYDAGQISDELLAVYEAAEMATE